MRSTVAASVRLLRAWRIWSGSKSSRCKTSNWGGSPVRINLLGAQVVADSAPVQKSGGLLGQDGKVVFPQERSKAFRLHVSFEAQVSPLEVSVRVVELFGLVKVEPSPPAFLT